VFVYKPAGELSIGNHADGMVGKGVAAKAMATHLNNWYNEFNIVRVVQITYIPKLKRILNKAGSYQALTKINIRCK
jgi:hypothetical protein